jgi:hypothetical protein
MTDQTNTYKQIVNVVNKSSLSESDKVRLLNLLTFLPKDNLEQLYALYTDDSRWVQWSLENYNKKRAAFLKKDSVLLKSINTEELAMLEEENK